VTGSRSGLAKELATHAAGAFLALGALALAEVIAVGAASWSRFAGPYELGRAVRLLVPLAGAAAAACAVVGAALVALVLRGETRGGRFALAALAAAFGGVVGAGVTTGRHFEDAGRRAGFVGALAVVLAAAAFFCVPALARAVRTARPWTLGAALVGLVVGLELANVLVLPRLYPAFHAGLAALAVAVACLAPLALRPADERAAPPFSVARVTAIGLVALTALAIVPRWSRSLALADNLRLIYLDRAPLAGSVVRGAAALAPPRPVDDAPLAEARSGHAVDLTGRDIVLVSIDALRADHVGAYGYDRRTTPAIDALAADGVVFEAAYTPTPHTSYAVTSLMTGKYMRPLLLQGLGADSETWPQHLRRYGYRTAAFYPPAVFFIDGEKFAPFRDTFLGFEYRKVEFADAGKRVEQVEGYLKRVPADRRLFLWVHLFEPHEPYEAHPEHAVRRARHRPLRRRDRRGRRGRRPDRGRRCAPRGRAPS
jgi:hypothetical protein